MIWQPADDDHDDKHISSTLQSALNLSDTEIECNIVYSWENGTAFQCFGDYINDEPFTFHLITVPLYFMTKPLAFFVGHIHRKTLQVT